MSPTSFQTAPPRDINKKEMGGGGFEPPKHYAADLQSVPFGHSGIHPFFAFQQKADDRTRTDNLLITNQLLCQLTDLEIGNIVDGEVLPIEDCCDDICAHKLLGDGLMIRPIHGLVVAPCDGTISMIYPTKHALGIELENGMEILIHFGINTVKLNGQGFELLVKINQKVKKGDLLWNADLNYIKENAIDDCLLMIITKGQGPLEKNYGHKKSGETILKIKR